MFSVVAPLAGGQLVASTVGLLAARGMGHSSNTAFFPAKDEAWINAFISLNGNAPSETLAIQLGCAILAALLFSLSNSKGIAVAIAILGVIVSTVLAALSFGCHPVHCPDDAPWRWLLVGTAIKLVFALGAMSHQLGVLQWAKLYGPQTSMWGRELRPGDQGYTQLHQMGASGLGSQSLNRSGSKSPLRSRDNLGQSLQVDAYGNPIYPKTWAQTCCPCLSKDPHGLDYHDPHSQYQDPYSSHHDPYDNLHGDHQNHSPRGGSHGGGRSRFG